MHCAKKNSYLQSLYAEINPAILNRCVDKARKLKHSDPHDGQPPFQRLISQQPVCKPLSIDFTRSRCGFGRTALHQLKRDLHSYDIQLVMRAVNTIGDLLANPEQSWQLTELRIHESLSQLLEKKDVLLKARVFKTLYRLANVPNGKMAIVKHKRTLDRFQTSLKQRENVNVMVNLAKCLENLSSCITCADELVDQGFICTLIDVLPDDTDKVTIILLSALSNLMYGNGNYVAMEYGAFSLMVSLLDRDNEQIQIDALNCLMRMTSTPLGKRLALDCNLLQILTNLLWRAQSPQLDTAVTSVMMFCTILTEAKIRASHIMGIIPRLMRISRNSAFEGLQMFSMATILNLVVQHKLREIIGSKYATQIKKTQCANAKVFSIRENILQELSSY